MSVAKKKCRGTNVVWFSGSYSLSNRQKNRAPPGGYTSISYLAYFGVFALSSRGHRVMIEISQLLSCPNYRLASTTRTKILPVLGLCTT